MQQVVSNWYTFGLGHANIEIRYPCQKTPWRTTRKDVLKVPDALHVAITHQTLDVLVVLCLTCSSMCTAMADDD